MHFASASSHDVLTCRTRAQLHLFCANGCFLSLAEATKDGIAPRPESIQTFHSKPYQVRARPILLSS